jgi:RNA polymerase subunit RPABC4/transcription elongation factor Spt4
MSTSKTYEMLWDCKYCGTKKLLGKTHRFCPNCGAAQDPDSRYFPSDDEKIAIEDHKLVGKDKVCPACDTLNSGDAQFCQQCGSPLDKAEEAKTLADQVRDDNGKFESSGSRDLEKEEFDADMQRIGLQAAPQSGFRGGRRTLYLIALFVVIVIAGVLVAFFWRRETSAYVTGHSWEREVRIEQLAPQSESAWCDAVPAGAYSITRRQEQRSSRQIPDGQECSVRRVDNGDGTFSERQECRTKYREEPVYDMRCYFTVDRWGYSRSAVVGGDSLNDEVFWPRTNITRSGNCLGCEREAGRAEEYLVHFRSGDSTYTCDVTQEMWRSMTIESTWTFNVGVITGSPECGSLKRAG